MSAGSNMAKKRKLSDTDPISQEDDDDFNNDVNNSAVNNYM